MTPTEIRAWRTAAGLSQPSLAQLLGVDVMTVSRWERGITEPQPYLYLALLGVTEVLSFKNSLKSQPTA